MNSSLTSSFPTILPADITSCAGAADQSLLLAIIASHDVKVDFAKVAKDMGDICTPRAVQERLKRLKKVGGIGTQSGGGEAGEASAGANKTTPSKRPRTPATGDDDKSNKKPKTTVKKRKAGGAGRKRNTVKGEAKGDVKQKIKDEEPDEDEEDQEDEEEVVPSIEGDGI